MNNYYASEHALTKATKELWEKRNERAVYPPFDDNKIEMFQQNRLFSVIRQDNIQQ